MSSKSASSKELPVSNSRSTCANCDCHTAESGSRSAAYATAHQAEENTALLDAPEHVLSTLEKDGSRRWLYPRLAKGKWWHRRRWVGYGLIAFFVALPHFRINQKPPILLDILKREFTFVGHTFLPSDTFLLALVLLSVALLVIAITALTGRVWCGWGCPQTVYMEYVFRPIDRWFQGTKGKGGKPSAKRPAWMQIARIAVYTVLCIGLAHTFLAYFVGTDNLRLWLTGSPFNHPVAFAVMAIVTGAMMFDFLYFREQTCLIACPYGRLQSVMLDRHSLIVAYDSGRGEPRKKGKRQPNSQSGDCVECNRCVEVCPTGIDIRDGLQMECINCTQCIDACDDVMTRVGQPTGLIRYSSQDALCGNPRKIIRPRVVAYPLLLLAIGLLFVYVLSTKYAFDTNLIRENGNPYYTTPSGDIANRFKLLVTNRSDSKRVYSVSIISPKSAEIQYADDKEIQLATGDSESFSIRVIVPQDAVSGSGKIPFEIKIVDDLNNDRTLKARLIGPQH